MVDRPPSNRTNRPSEKYPEDWKYRRREALRRDRYTCQNCGREGGPHGDADLEVDHDTPLHAGGSHQLKNLRTKCKRCHAAKHGDGRAAGYYFDISHSEPTETFEALLETAHEYSALFFYDEDRERYYISRANFQEELSPAEKRLFEQHDAIEPNWE